MGIIQKENSIKLLVLQILTVQICKARSFLLRGYRVTRFSGTHSKSTILQMGEVLIYEGARRKCPWGTTGIVRRIEKYGIIGQKSKKTHKH